MQQMRDHPKARLNGSEGARTGQPQRRMSRIVVAGIQRSGQANFRSWYVSAFRAVHPAASEAECI